jgi:hypothetical protein
MLRRRMVRLQRFERLSPLSQVHPISGVPVTFADPLSPYELMILKSIIR